jgi:lathosterol oxidase
MSLFLLSGGVFHRYYWNPTFEQWQRKSNPKFPTAEMVRGEIYHMLKGAAVGVMCPVVSLWMSANGHFKGYCGFPHGASWEIFMFFFIWFFTDFFEFSYHKLGHTKAFFWMQHKSHHRFYNPSPFAVIADDAIDQLIRSTPLILIPMTLPTNMDLMFLEFVVFFYGYGIYLHWGYEMDWPDAHHPYINTSFQHYLHHSKSGATTPYHCGFFFKFWDKLFDVEWKKECFCAKCERAKGNRSLEKWKKTEKPDYSPLFSIGFWAEYFIGKKVLKTSTSG